jgi:hypothetical protein
MQIPQVALEYANNYSKFYPNRVMANLRVSKCHPFLPKYRVLASIYAWPTFELISESEFIPGLFELIDGQLYLMRY